MSGRPIVLRDENGRSTLPSPQPGALTAFMHSSYYFYLQNDRSCGQRTTHQALAAARSAVLELASGNELQLFT